MFTWKYHTGPLNTQCVISAPEGFHWEQRGAPDPTTTISDHNAVVAQLFDLLYFLCLGWFSSWLIAGDSDHLCTGGTEAPPWLRSGSSWRCSPPSQSGCDDALFERLKTGGKWHPGVSHPHSESAPELLRPSLLFRSPARLSGLFGPHVFSWLPTAFLRERCLLGNL